MSMHYAIRLIAGGFVLVSIALGYWVSPLWFLFTAFVGVNLIQSAFTRWCLMETILTRLHLVQPDDPGASGVTAASGTPASRRSRRPPAPAGTS